MGMAEIDALITAQNQEIADLKKVVSALQADNQQLERQSLDMEDLLHKVDLSLNECLVDAPQPLAEKLSSLSKEIDEYFAD